MVVDFARFYTFKNGSNAFNTSPQWSDEFNGNNIDYGKWLVANWTFAATQFSPQNILVKDGFLTLRVDRDLNTAGPVSNTNLAPSGTASQSSTYGSASANRAIDGSTDGRYNNGSVTHSQFQTNAWWEVDLLGESEIDRISIHNRTDCCADRLSSYSVSVFDDNNTVIWSQFYTDPPSPVQEIDLDVRAKKVRINLVEGALSLAEVQVFGTGPTAPAVSAPGPVSPEPPQPTTPGITNLALAGTASQSTTAHQGVPSRAIDNNTNGNWNAGSITHTRNRNNSWWQVELPSTSSINQIVLHNRTNCCSSRLSNFTVSVLDENGSEVWSQFFSDTPSPSLSINLNRIGKTVRVSLSGTLSLAEVEVFGSN